MMDSFSMTSVDGGETHLVHNEGDALSVRDYETAQFDIVVGHIEDILVEDEFQHLKRTFMEKYWQEFDNSEENKLIYMDIFNEYVGVIELYIEDRLNGLIPDFSMNNFLSELIKQKDSLDGEVFEVLYTFSEFGAFKEMFLDYKAMKEGVSVDFSEGMTITSLPYESDNF